MIDIKDKGYVKLMLDGKASTLHYIKDNNNVYSLTLSSSKKVAKINENIESKILFGKNIDDAIDTKINIISEKAEVKDLFDKLLDMKFTHYKKYNDDLVVLEMPLV
jgi:hypothetical protein